MAIAMTVAPEKITASKNDAWVTVQTAEINVLIRMEVLSQPAAQKIATVFAPVDSTGTAYFNLKRILQAMGITPDLLQYQLPSFNQIIVTKAVNNIKSYSLKFITVDKATNTDVTTLVYNPGLEVLLAGKSFINGNKTLLSITGDGAAQRKFLTCQPKEKKTATTTQQYLYYLHNSNGLASGDIVLNVKLHFNDGSFVNQLLLPFTIANGEIAIFPVGYTQLNLASFIPAGKTLINYDVFLVLQSATAIPITNTFTYTLDRRCLIRKKEFLFINSLGGMDTTFVVDTDEVNTSTMFETAERFLQPAYNINSGQFYNFYKDHFDGAKCTTDLLTYDERLYLKDFFSSMNVWEITATDFIPVIFTDTNFVLNKSRPELQNIEFSFRYAFDEVAYNNF